MKTRLGYLYLIAMCWLAIPNISLAGSAETIDELKRCAKIPDQNNRIDCYEALGQRVLQEDESGNKPAAVSTGTAAVAATPGKEDSGDTLGGYKFEKNTAGSSDAKPAAAVSTGTAAVVAPSDKEKSVDTIGGYKYEENAAGSPESNDDIYHTRVIQCQKDSGGSWYFKFENGQVWKQVDRRVLNFQGCDLAVTVTDGGMGYSMKIDGKKGKIRISRRK